MIDRVLNTCLSITFCETSNQPNSHKACIILIRLFYLIFKVGLSSSKNFFYFNKSPLKMMKNAFYLMLKVLSFLRYLHFSPDLLLILKSGLLRKQRLISNFMTSQTGQQIITIQILPNI